MKPSSILLGVILVLCVGVGAILFSGGGSTTTSAASGGSGVVAENAGTGRQTEGLGLAPDAPSAAADDQDAAASGRVAIADPAKAAAASVSNSAPKGPFLRGAVTDTDGLVIPGATLKFTGEGPAATILNFAGSPFVERTESGSGGDYKVTRRGLLGDDLTVYVRARGYLPLQADRTVGEGEGDLWLDDFELERGVVLAGLVLDADGAPVAGAEIIRTTPDDEGRFSGAFFFGRNGKAIVSEEDGSFELPNEEAGRFVLLVTHDDYPRARLEGDAPYPGFEDSGLVVSFPATATISGRIAGMPLGRKGVVVHAVPSESASDTDTLGPMEVFMAMAGQEGGVRGKPDQDGNFKITGVDPGRSYELMAMIEGGIMNQVRCSERQRVVGGAEDVSLAWDSGASVVFKLVDAKTKKPIKASTVNHRWSDEDFEGFQMGSTKRDFMSSHIEITELRPNPAPSNLELMISADGYLEFKPEPVKIDEDANVDLGTIELTRAPIVRVHVVDAGTGKDMRRARVSLQPDLEEADNFRTAFGGLNPKGSKGRTEKDGLCELGACASETATLTVKRSGYADYKLEEIAMPTAGQLELEVRMSSGGELVVTIVDSTGEPVGKAQIKYRGPEETKGSATASGKGTIKLKDLPGGEYELLAERPSESRGGPFSVAFEGDGEQPELWQRVTVMADSKQSVTLRVPQETVLTGTVTANGAPLVGADVTFVSGPIEKAGEGEDAAVRRSMRNFGGGKSGETDARGNFEIGGLSAGSHRLRIDAGPGAPSHIVAVELVEGSNRTTIALEVGTLSGRITNSSGGPIAGATVSTIASGKPDESGQMLFAGGMFGGGGGRGGVKTDASGHFEVTGLPLGSDYRVSASASGFVKETGSESFAVGSKDIEVALSNSASIRVKLVGEAKAWSTVTATQVDGGSSKNEWVRGSQVVFKDLEPGKWSVRINNRNGEDGPASEVTVSAGEVAEVTLER